MRVRQELVNNNALPGHGPKCHWCGRQIHAPAAYYWMTDLDGSKWTAVACSWNPSTGQPSGSCARAIRRERERVGVRP